MAATKYYLVSLTKHGEIPIYVVLKQYELNSLLHKVKEDVDISSEAIPKETYDFMITRMAKVNKLKNEKNKLRKGN